MARGSEQIVADTVRYAGIRSVSGEERTLARQVTADLREMGYKPQSICDGNDVLLHIPGKNRNSLLVINGHLDTVPFRRFSTRKSGNWLIGPGTGDMKAGLAIMMDMAREYAQKKPESDVLLSFVPMEEIDGSGALRHAQWIRETYGSQYERIEGVILEPTYDQNKGSVCFGHRGGAIVTVSASGMRGHAGRKVDYDTATDKIGKFVGDRRIIQETLERNYSDDFGVPTINIVDFTAGYIADNVIPRRATAQVAIRTTATLASEWDIFVQLIKEQYGVKVHPPENPEYLDVSFCDPDSGVFQSFLTFDLPFIPFFYFSDQPNFAKYGIPTILYGPGDTKYAHQSDRVDIRAIGEHREYMRALAREYALFQRSSR